MKKDHYDEWYGWIPSLTGKEPHVLMDHPIPESTTYFKFTKYEDDPKAFYADVNVKGINHIVSVAIHEGFIVIMFDDLDEKYQKIVANELFSTLISYYHVDITHDNENRLAPVNAKGYKDAAYKYASRILAISEDFVTLSATTTDVEALKKVYLTRLGIVEYGKAFLKRYENDLNPQTIEECKERLESMSRFIDAIYGTIRDSIQDNLAHRSQEMSESMERLARNTETLSIIVLGLSWFSAVVALASLSLDYDGLSTPSIWAVAAAAITPPVVIFVIHRVIRHYWN